MPTPQRRRRWPIVVAAALAVVVVIVAAMVVVAWSKRDGGIGPRPAWQPTAQTILASSMAVQPVAGWRTSVADLGLPTVAPGPAAQSRISTSDDPYWSNPFVGNLGNDAYFVAGSPGAPHTQWWLVAVDVRDGQRLFAPVQLNAGTRAPNCFLNGPRAVLCLRDDTESSSAWVIDARSGRVSYTGPTDLRTYPAKLTVHQVGIYAIAETENEGVYGVGQNAETTWFVPGDGSVDQKYPTVSDSAPLTLASQGTQGRGSFGKVVFSLSDGTVIKPELDANAQQQLTVVYPGGFAAEIALSQTRTAVQFFDDEGRRTSGDSIRGSLSNDSHDLPIVGLVHAGWAVYAPDGRQLLGESGDTPGDNLLIGSRFFVRDYSDSITLRWQQYDLRTGQQGEACQYSMYGYIASDGTVGVFEGSNPNVGLVTEAMDLATCDILWTVTSAVGSFRDMWRVNTTLVQLSDDGTELVSLVAPG